MAVEVPGRIGRTSNNNLGSGYTTLLRLIQSIVKSSSGKIKIEKINLLTIRSK
jgi:ABC-type Na+ transport system ATPase subunit NatA